MLGIDLVVINMARLFEDSGTDPDQDALFWVVENRSVEIVRFLLEEAPNPKTRYSFLLH